MFIKGATDCCSRIHLVSFSPPQTETKTSFLLPAVLFINHDCSPSDTKDLRWHSAHGAQKRQNDAFKKLSSKCLLVSTSL